MSPAGTQFKNSLSIVILTHNSSTLIRDCLESAKWASEIVVLDDCSTDDTVKIAQSYTDKVLIRKWDIEGIHRNFAYSQVNSDYILSLDSDERITPELRDEILGMMKEGFKFNCYNIPHRNYFGDKWLRFGGWYPNAKLKMYKKILPIYEETEPHPRALIPGERYTLKNDILHLAYKNTEQLIAKLNYQTTMEARKWVNDKRKVTGFNSFRKAIDRFFRAYLFKSGYRDGFAGFLCALSGGLYQILTHAKYQEISKIGQLNHKKEGELVKKLTAVGLLLAVFSLAGCAQKSDSEKMMDSFKKDSNKAMDSMKKEVNKL